MRVEQIWSYVIRQMKVAKNAKGIIWWEELIHGGRHVRNVVEEAEILAVKCNLEPKLGRCLKMAAQFHDLGRLGLFQYENFEEHMIVGLVDQARIDPNNRNYIDHACLSAELFYSLKIDDCEIREKSAIEWAIRHHSVGLVGLHIEQARTFEEQLLGLLVVCDHCGDGACPEGLARTARDLKERGVPVLSNKYIAAELNMILGDKNLVIPVARAAEYKNDSLTAHLVYNYQATRPIVAAVAPLLSPDYLAESIFPKREMYKSIIMSFLALQK